eukprot:EG_transcript_10681
MARFRCVAASLPAEFPPLPHAHFLKAVKWSPDGTQLLSNSEDHKLRCFPLPFDLYGAADERIEEVEEAAGLQARLPLASSRQFKESDCIYDFAWYPGSEAEASRCFASTACDAPIHLWDIETGGIRATYRAYGHADEVVAAFSVAFTSDSARLLGGYKNFVRIFDVGRPGRDCQEINVLGKKKAREVGGMIASVACRPDSSMFAIGSFNSKVGLYDRQQRQGLVAVLEAHRGGVTQVLFSSNGTLLATGARREATVYCWDVRRLASPLFAVERQCRNNQKVLFDFDWLGHHLYSACQSGHIKVFELQQSGALVGSHSVAEEAVNCVAVHPRLPLLATSSGERVTRPLRPPNSDSDSSDSSSEGSDSSTSPGPEPASGVVAVWCGTVLRHHYELALEAGEAEAEVAADTAAPDPDQEPAGAAEETAEALGAEAEAAVSQMAPEAADGGAGSTPGKAPAPDDGGQPPAGTPPLDVPGDAAEAAEGAGGPGWATA